NIWKRYSMRVSKNWVKFNKMFTLSPCVTRGLLDGRGDGAHISGNKAVFKPGEINSHVYWVFLPERHFNLN
ncbi:hypothetical protein, partial [Aeromonas sp. QDB11]|uniref:hypothetical protein n=1 Tax=Aeromonas sp. QDB11 TaxID=2990482 RepID=UPI0022E0FB2D